MNNEQKAANLPAYPPQFVQDSLGRLVAPIPGMTLRQAVAMAVLPALIQSNNAGCLILDDIELAFNYADQFCKQIDNENAASNPLQIIT
jgi:hypothetical protein